MKNTQGQNDGFIVKLAVIASLSGLLFGYDTGVVSGAIIFLRGDMGLSPFQLEVVVSSTVLAAGCSALGGSMLLDSIGRKKTLMLASAIFVLGSLIMAFAYGPNGGYFVLVFGRIIVGTAVGLAADAGPLYISECAPPHLRGSLTTLFNIAVVGGQVLAATICGCLSYLPPSYNWRLMLGGGAIPALLQMMGFAMLPFSPTWLVLVGRKDEAEAVLRNIRPAPAQVSKADSLEPNTDSDSESNSNSKKEDEETDPVMQELNEIVREHEVAKKSEHVSLLQLWWRHPRMRKIMFLGCSLWAVSQLAGINTIMYYGATIVRKIGIGGGNKSFDIWITVPLSLLQLLGIFVCFSIIDKKGRRTTLLTSSGLVCASLFMIGLGFSIDNSILTLLAMFMYLFSFGLGLSTLPYIMNAEIYPEEYRGSAVAQATGVFWFTNFVVSVTFLTLSHALGNGGVFFLYTAIVAVSLVYFYFNVPETSGLSLQEIQELFMTPEEAESLSLEDKEEYGATDEVEEKVNKLELV
jgi:SP family myo-inositol transporter-like MFS transporter 13